MSVFPYHVAGGVMRLPRNTFATPPDTGLGELPPTGTGTVRTTTSRRRRLWEIPHKFHCPIIGVCFACDELRSLMNKVMNFPKDTTDFVLHTTAAAACEERGRLAELLQKTLEKRFQLTIRQFSPIRTNAELRSAWQHACKEAGRIPAVLWAAWTHPACDSKLEQDIYADIHMIQHQLGAGTRADIKAMHRLEAENREQRRQLDAAKAETDLLRTEKLATANAAMQQIRTLRGELAAKEAAELAARRELSVIRALQLDQDRYHRLEQQLHDAEQTKLQLKGVLDEQAGELKRLREFAAYAEEMLESIAREDDALGELPAADLSGKCVLCVGGRSGAVHSYREVVEQSGGRFLHHDGGLEQSLHRIDGALAAADIVICQAGCISHNAYWRVKDLCKRTGKPCMFVKNSSVSSFGKALGGTTGDKDRRG